MPNLNDRLFCAIIFAPVFATDAYSAYSCPTYKQYTSCNSGYYLNGTGAGNSCSSCPSGCTCAGGTAAPVCCTNTCTSTNNTTSTQSCTATCSVANGSCTCQSNAGTQTCNGKYTGGNNCTGSCTGCSSYGTCSGCGTQSTSCNSGYYLSGTSCPACGGNKWYCPGNNNYYDVSAGYYTTGGTSTTRTGQAQCPAGTYCTNGEKNNCDSGYTSAAGATARTQCYRSCSVACTQQTCPANATCTHGTTSTSGTQYYGGACNASSSTCSITITCNAGYYLESGACKPCNGNQWYCPGDNNWYTVSAGYYSTGGTSTTRTGQAECTNATYCSGGVQYNCPDEYTANTTAGKTANTQCTINVGSGNYIATKNSTTTTACPDGTYMGAHTVAYGTTSECAACPNGYPYSDNGRASAHDCWTRDTTLITCKPANAYSGTGWDYYDNNDNGGSGHNRCLYTVSKCKNGYYLTANTCTKCPADFPLTDPRTADYSDEKSIDECWRDCNASDVPNSTARTGWKTYGGSNNCAATACADKYSLTTSNICAQLCTTGITHIKIGSLSIPLYSARQTTPAINVRYQDAVCYGSLADGNSTDSLNLKYSGKEYHTIN